MDIQTNVDMLTQADYKDWNHYAIQEKIQKLRSKLEKSSPSRNGYTYFFPSPNEGKRLLITGWIDPSKAALIAENILLGKKTVDDYDCVEEIDLAYKE